jgi:hypothetical protein
VKSQVPYLISFIYENNIEAVEKKYSMQIAGESFDYACISLCYTNIMVGAYLAIGYKYAGTGDQHAFKLINDFAMQLKNQKLAT